MIDHGPGFLFFGGIQILFWFVLAGGVALLVVWAIHASAQRTNPAGPAAAGPTPQRETPLDILARRFASGEITAEEYELGRDLLGGGGKPT